MQDEVWKIAFHVKVVAKAMKGHATWLRIERHEGIAYVNGDTCLRCERKAGVSAPIVPIEFTGSGVPQTGGIQRYLLKKNAKNLGNKPGLGKWCRKADA